MVNDLLRKPITVIFLTGLVVAYVLSNHYFTLQFKMPAFFNSDGLYIPDLSRDILSNGIGQLSNWNLSRAPSLVDLIIFLLINIFFNSFNSIFVFILLQLLLTLYVVYRIYMMKFNENEAAIFASLGFSLLFLLVIQEIYPHFIILKIAHHYSEFLVSLISALYVILYLKNQKFISLQLFTLICLFQCISDQLYYLHFIIPALIYVTIYIMKNTGKRHEAMKLGLSLIICAVLGYYISSFFLGTSGAAPKQLMSIRNVQDDIQRLFDLLININLKSILILATNIIFFSYCFYAIYKKNNDVSWATFFLLSFLTTVLVLLISPSSNVIGRYLLPYIYIPIFFLFYIFPKISINRYKSPGIIGLLLIYVILVNKTDLKIWASEYYPSNVECVDNSLSEESISNVIGGYWEARLFTFLSKVGLQVVPYYQNFKQDKRVANFNRVKPAYSAILVDSRGGKGFTKNSAIEKFGKPVKMIDCKKNKILIYEKNSLIL